MGKSIIIAIDEPNVKSIAELDYGIVNLQFSPYNTDIRDLIPDAKSFREKDYSIINIDPEDYNAKAKSYLPFRVRFQSIDVVGYGPRNPAPIGIAIIGSNNYIL